MKTKMVSHTLETPPALTDAQRDHLAELAALPDETPGAPVFDRSGEWIAMAGAGGHAMNLGGVTLQSVWPVIGGEDIARFLVASGVVPSARPAATGTASASAIAASANAALLRVSCTR